MKDTVFVQLYILYAYYVYKIYVTNVISLLRLNCEISLSLPSISA